MQLHNLVELEALLPIMEEVIGAGEAFRFYPRGTSMQPMIVAGRDSVVLGKAENVTVGDVLFYRRDDGAFVLHRLVGVHKGVYTMCGDHQSVCVEHGIRPEQVLFKLVAFYTGEEYHSIEEEEYKEYTKKRLASIPFYYKNPVLHTALRKIKHILK